MTEMEYRWRLAMMAALEREILALDAFMALVERLRADLAATVAR